MATYLSDIETISRRRLTEITPRFWTSDELIEIIAAGCRDLWRDIVDLKQEHFLTVNNADVYLASGDKVLSGVPKDIHKIYLLEPLDITENSSNVGLQFQPLDYNHRTFQLARSRGTIDPSNDTIYYSIQGAGAPVNAPIIRTAPMVSSRVNISFSYCPTLGDLSAADKIPIPGEATNALTAWTVAFARAKEREDRGPDPGWLAIFATEKMHLLQSLGLRQYQEPLYSDAVYQEYW